MSDRIDIYAAQVAAEESILALGYEVCSVADPKECWVKLFITPGPIEP